MSFFFLTACVSNEAVPVTEVTIDMHEFMYAPSSITIPANQPVVFTLTNSGEQQHNFVIQEIAIKDVSMEGNLAQQIQTNGGESNYDLEVLTAVGNTSILRFTATEPGTYKIFCSMQGHEVAGMLGELIVVSQ